MERARPTTQRGRDPGNVVAWRRDRLERAGVPATAAAALARDRTVDVHALLDLLEQGCPVELAVRIFAPLDDGGPAR